MEAVVVLALLVALSALVFGEEPVSGDGFRPLALHDPARPTGTRRRPSRSPESAPSEASGLRKPSASHLPAGVVGITAQSDGEHLALRTSAGTRA